MLGQIDALPAQGEAAHQLWQRLEPQRLPADVMLRLSSNLCRCLVLQAPARSEPLRADLTALRDELQQPRYAACRPKEDHRALVQELLDGVSAWCEAGAPSGRGEPPAFALAALNADTPQLRSGLRALWS